MKYIIKYLTILTIAVLAFGGIAGNSYANTVTYTLNNVFLQDDEQITGSFLWTYNKGDFEGGSGNFTTLEIPHTTAYTFAKGNLKIEVQTNSIEITGDGNYHDAGLDISIFLLQPFTPTQSASIDLGRSFFECCGNGFRDQPFISGNISPIPEPEIYAMLLAGLALLGFAARRRDKKFN